MTQTLSKGGRRRCCECRSWYVPSPSAVNTQRTCSRRCRLRRRAKQAKRRREADLLNARVDERERQRKHQAGKREEGGLDPPLSRTGLPTQVRAAVEEILQDLGQAYELSRAGLRRRVRHSALKRLGNLCRSGANLGQDAPLSLTGLGR
jgi:hypothetical protein